MTERGAKPILRIRDLHVDYGESHAIQGVSLSLASGILAIVGRNGMGKTTLCNTIMGLKRARTGSIAIAGREAAALLPHEISRLGVGYVPQGRGVWPSLTVDEHLRLVARGGPDAAWTVERIYQTFPRLAQRRRSGGALLSGGEQQMLALSRALLSNPKLLVMDEPTEGLAPTIVERVEGMLDELRQDEDISVLVIEQNIGVATRIAEQIAIMVNGRINRIMPAAELAADRELQRRLLGVGRHAEEPSEAAEPQPVAAGRELMEVVRVMRRGAIATDSAASGNGSVYRTIVDMPNRWSVPVAAIVGNSRARRPDQDQEGKLNDIPPMPMPAQGHGTRSALVVGTYDTKGRELRFIRDCLRDMGVRTRTVDLSTSGKPSTADVVPMEVASAHPGGASAVFSGDRGRSVEAMARAFEHWIARQLDVGGIIAAGGSGGTALATPGMRRLPVGIPKVMISTVASGDVSRYVGPSDLLMMHSVADVQGLNSITERVLRNGAGALAGMMAQARAPASRAAERRLVKPALGVTMFGVTTPCVQALTAELGADYDCLVFHATGTGGRAMENLADSGLLAGALDVTTTEVADMVVGGVFPATEDRFGAFIRRPLPYVGSVGALDMVNFGPRDTVPEKFRRRNLVQHNPQVTLMRTTRDENVAFGTFIGERLNRMQGPVRFLMPENGVSSLDAPGKPFHDPEADNALFETIEKTVVKSGGRRVERVTGNINDASFVAALLRAFREIAPRVHESA
ncbi:MAG: ABC transporter permease [Methylobacteriaceae bacterium]|nr:ABC transporter permease [Methylobacteriaceae bacterium]MBV9244767.1 ABC transporter permease [Methylobacteriaceae bacterium]